MDSISRKWLKKTKKAFLNVLKWRALTLYLLTPFKDKVYLTLKRKCFSSFFGC